MTLDEFILVLDKIKPYTDFIYYHVLGEPLLHKELFAMLKAADGKGFKSCITTNGSLLKDRGFVLTDFVNGFSEEDKGKCSLHKISISLQAQEANESLLPLEEYMKDVCLFSKKIEGKTIISYRLWNEGGLNKNNERIISLLQGYYPGEWKEHPKGFTIGEKTYLEFDSSFKWPDIKEDERKDKSFYCYGLKDQIGILADGTVVPCCLDAEGSLALGNILREDPEEILGGPRASAIYDGFKKGKATEELCRKCGYAARFTKQNTHH